MSRSSGWKLKHLHQSFCFFGLSGDKLMNEITADSFESIISSYIYPVCFYSSAGVFKLHWDANNLTFNIYKKLDFRDSSCSQ